MSLLLLGQVGQPGLVLVMVLSAAQESKPHHTGTFHIRVVFAKIPLVKPSHIVEVKGKYTLPVG